MSYASTYSELEEENVSVTSNLSYYVTQKEFKNVTKVDTSDFALKTNVAEIKKKVDDIDVDKIDFIDELQGKNYIEDSYLYFKLEQRYLETSKLTKTNVFSWKSVGLSDEKIKSSGETYSPTLPFDKEKKYLTFNSDILAQEKIVYNHESVVNIYVVYTLLYWPNSTIDCLKNCLFGAIAFYRKWSGYGLAFGIKDYVHTESGKNAKNLVILCVDTSDDDKTTENNILVLGKGSVSITRTETIKAKKEIKTNCTITNEKFVLSLHYNGDDSYLFVNGIGQYRFKEKSTEIKPRKLCLVGFSDDTYLFS